MPINLTITGNTGPEAVQELFAFLGNLQQNLSHGAAIVSRSQADAPVNSNSSEPEVAETKKPKKAKEPKEEKAAEAPAEKSKASKFTLQEAIDKARGIAGDGKDEKIMTTLAGINTKMGIGKVRDLPPEKIDGYMEELSKAFPAPALGSMF